jgi:hypothetical protein
LPGKGPVVLINSSISHSLADVGQAPLFFYTIPRELGKGRNGTIDAYKLGKSNNILITPYSILQRHKRNKFP